MISTCVIKSVEFWELEYCKQIDYLPIVLFMRTRLPLTGDSGRYAVEVLGGVVIGCFTVLIEDIMWML